LQTIARQGSESSKPKPTTRSAGKKATAASSRPPPKTRSSRTSQSARSGFAQDSIKGVTLFPTASATPVSREDLLPPEKQRFSDRVKANKQTRAKRKELQIDTSGGPSGSQRIVEEAESPESQQEEASRQPSISPDTPTSQQSQQSQLLDGLDLEQSFNRAFSGFSVDDSSERFAEDSFNQPTSLFDLRSIYRLPSIFRLPQQQQQQQPATMSQQTQNPATGGSSQNTVHTRSLEMPNPFNKNAPKFDGKADELDRFLTHMRDLMQRVGITSDDEQMLKICDYVETQTAREWKHLKSYRKGSWDDFRSEVLENYPEADDIVQGTVIGLEKVCAKFRGLASKDLNKVMAFKRAFVVEQELLCDSTIPLVTNRELVKMLLGTLDPAYAYNVRTYLRNKIGESAPPPGQTSRRPEDPFSIEDVWKALIHEAKVEKMGSAGELYVPKIAARGSSEAMPMKAEDQNLQQLEGSIARLTDAVNAQSKSITEVVMTQGKNNESWLKSFQQDLARMAKEGISNSYRDRMEDVSVNAFRQPPRSVVGNAQNDSCYYCWESGHFVPDCKHFHEHLAKGFIKKSANKRGYELPGGAVLPREHNTATPPKFRVEAWHAARSRSSNVQSQWLVTEDEAWNEGLIEMSPPRYSTSEQMEYLVQDYQPPAVPSRSLNSGMQYSAMQNEISSLREQVARLESVGKSSSQPKAVHFADGPSQPSVGEEASDDFVKFAASLWQAQKQNVLTRTGQESAPRKEKGF
jgi:hypothetical protein